MTLLGRDGCRSRCRSRSGLSLGGGGRGLYRWLHEPPMLIVNSQINVKINNK